MNIIPQTKYDYQTVYASSFETFDKDCQKLADDGWLPIMSPYSVRLKGIDWLAQQWVKAQQNDDEDNPQADIPIQFIYTDAENNLLPEEKIIEDSDGDKWVCFQAPMQDPHLYEEDEVFVHENVIYLKGKKLPKEDVDKK